MFTQIFSDLAGGEPIDAGLLRRRFDVAMIKKLGVVKLPPSFWMQDSKINPRADHLLWVSLLLGDQDRVNLAFSALAVEHDELQQRRTAEEQESMAEVLQRSLQQLLSLLPEEEESRHQQMQNIVRNLISNL
jgi:hypothetical protein